MSIVRLKRVTVIGRVEDKATLLDGLQDLGCLHVTPMTRAAVGSAAAAAPDGGTAISNARKALKFLADAPYQRRQKTKDADFILSDVVDAVLAVKTDLRLAEDKRDFLAARIADVEPWGEIDFSPAGAPAGQHLWFYEVPLRQRAALERLDLPWSVVGKDGRVAYVAVIAPDEPPPGALPVPRVHLGSAPLADLRDQLREAEIAIDDLIAERVALTRYVYLLTTHLYEAENAAGLREAAHAAFDDDALTALQGWAPADRLEGVEAFAAEHGLAVIAQEPSAADDPPTLLHQPAKRQAGVDLSLFYQVPGYRSWDPSVVLLISFPLFFAMILADAGYGLVLLAGLGFFWRHLGRTERGRAYRRLGFWLTVLTILYGMLVGSYFGVAPPPESALARFNVLSINDFDAMMKLSIGVGVVHIVVANLIAAGAGWRAPDMLSKLGWVAATAGAYALYLEGGETARGAIWIGALGLGAALIFLFSSKAPARGLRDYGRRVFDGASALAGAMTAFGDVLSYMRLFALGLASASLAITFNQLAADAHAALPGLGLLAAVLIVLLGHTLNLVLGIVSGVVHGLRLNYIEFFKWGFDGEGVAFKPFAKKRVE